MGPVPPMGASGKGTAAGRGIYRLRVPWVISTLNRSLLLNAGPGEHPRPLALVRNAPLGEPRPEWVDAIRGP